MATHIPNPVFYANAANNQRQTLTFADANNPLYKLLQDENIKEFNTRRAKGESINLNGAQLRGLDLRGMNADGLDMSNAYMRGTDLRGIDFRNTKLEGASIAEAKISGCFFPRDLSAEEIRMSLEKGMRMRYR